MLERRLLFSGFNYTCVVIFTAVLKLYHWDASEEWGQAPWLWVVRVPKQMLTWLWFYSPVFMPPLTLVQVFNLEFLWFRILSRLRVEDKFFHWGITFTFPGEGVFCCCSQDSTLNLWVTVAMVVVLEAGSVYIPCMTWNFLCKPSRPQTYDTCQCTLLGKHSTAKPSTWGLGA